MGVNDLMAAIMGVPQTPKFDKRYHIQVVYNDMHHMNRFVGVEMSNYNIQEYAMQIMKQNRRLHETA